MKRQRNTAQMKEQTRNPEVQINEEKIGKLPEKEFRTMKVKMIKILENKMEKMQVMFTKDQELKNKQTERNNTLEGISNRIPEAEERISDLEEEWWKSLPQNMEKRRKRSEDSIRDLWDTIKHTNIHIIGVPEGEEREKGPKKIYEEIKV